MNSKAEVKGWQFKNQDCHLFMRKILDLTNAQVCSPCRLWWFPALGEWPHPNHGTGFPGADRPAEQRAIFLAVLVLSTFVNQMQEGDPRGISRL